LSLALRPVTDPQLFCRLPEVLTMAITVAAIDAIRTHRATLPQKDDTARELTRQEAIVRMSTVIWPRGRVDQGHDPYGYIDRSRCGEQLNPQLARSLPEVLTWR
jgi:hypothetical protein